jgi:hypothetical protein
MKNLIDRRIIGIIFDVTEMSLIDFSKTIEDNSEDMIFSLDDMTSVMWDIDDIPEDDIPDFVDLMTTKSRTFDYPELQSIKSLGYWK